MEDEDVLSILRQIRDLQKVHLESYREAVKNQQVAIELQQKATRLQRRSLLALLVVVFLALAFTVLVSSRH